MRATTGLFVALLFTAGHAHAAGFYIQEQDARATARAGAVTANPKNGSAIFYNPAGIALLEGLEVEAGVSIVTPHSTFTEAQSGTTTRMESNANLVPYGYATYRITHLVSAGVGVYAPFGLALAWPDTSPGRAIARRLELRSIFVTPTVGLDLSDWAPGLAFAAGLDMVPSSVRLDRDILFGTDVGTAALSGKALGWGARAGLLYRPAALPQTRFGLSYRSPVKLSFSGQGHFAADPTYRPALPPDGDISTSVTLPQSVVFGVSVDVLADLDLEADFDWIGHSSYDKLTIELPGGQSSTAARNWRNTVAVRFGGEYRIAGVVPVRAGVAWDQTPIPPETLDFTLPDANRVDIAFGAGYPFHSALRADVGALFVLPAKQTTSSASPSQPPIKGTYKIDAWVVSANLTVALGQPAPAPPTAPPAAAPAPAPTPEPAAAPAAAPAPAEEPAPTPMP